MFIASYDGGGILGCIPSTITERLQLAAPWLEHVDVFAGTSTGAILAASLAKGLSPADITELYQSRGPAIFGERDLADRLAGPLDEYLRANYGREGIRAALEDVFGDLTLGELPRKVVIVAIYLGDPSQPAKVKVFHNFDRPGNDAHVKVVDAVGASAAAPVYFPAHEAVDDRLPGRFIDGGLAANNPAACAWAATVKATGEAAHQLLSFSCSRRPLVVEGGDWGARQWVVKGQPLIELAFQTQVGVPDYIMRQALEAVGGAYFRVDPTAETDWGLDAVSDVPAMLQVARDYDIADARAWLNLHVSPEA